MPRKKLTQAEKEQKEIDKMYKKKDTYRNVKRVDWIADVSIDNITIVGDIADQEEMDRFMFLGSGGMNTTVWYSEGQNASGLWFDKIHWSLSPPEYKARDFRYEFNPNKLEEHEKQFLQEEVPKHLKNIGITRYDLAFDCDEDLLSYEFIDKYGKKMQKWYGTDRVLETIYLGAQGSEEQIRIYNKYREQKDKIKKSLRGIYQLRQHHVKALGKKHTERLASKYGMTKEEVNELKFQHRTSETDEVHEFYLEQTDYITRFDARLKERRDQEATRQVREMQKEEGLDEHWVRLEFQFRREDKSQLLRADAEETPFDKIRIMKYAFERLDNWRDAAMLSWLKDHPEIWTTLNWETKKRYKNLLSEAESVEVTEAFLKEFKEKKSDLRHEVVKYLNTAQDWERAKSYI